MTDLVGLLRRLGVPALFLELMVLAYRHIFILLESARQIRQAQSARLGYATGANAWRALAALGGSLLVRTTWRSRQIHQALLARGYEGELRCLEAQHNWSLRNLLCGSLGGVIILTLALWPPR
jgi:cobalt/nickel transport system permease protein